MQLVRIGLIAMLLATTAAAQTQTGRAVFRGTVHDTTGAPLVTADVYFPDLIVSTRTDAQGAFRIINLPAGSHRVLVRRVGYAPATDSITVAVDDTVRRDYVLARIVTLDTVVSSDSYRDPGMLAFEEHRRMGLGHFFTRADLARHEGALISSFLQQTPGLVVVGAGSMEWVTSKRGPRSSTCGLPNSPPRAGVVPKPGPPSNYEVCLKREGVFYYPDSYEQAMGMPVLCHSRVYLDNQLMNPQRPATPFDLRQISPSQVEAMEFFDGPGQVPAEFQARDTRCGVLVIHTRRPEK